MTRADISRRTAYAWLAAVVVGAALLRWSTIGREALWGDEALSAVIARYPARTLWLEPVDPTGPVYYLIHRILVPMGSSATIARLPSLLAGLVTVIATYGLGRAVGSRFAGALAATLVAVSGAMIEYSQEARGYAVLVAFVTLSAWALASLFRPHSTRKRYVIAAAYIVTTIAASSTHLVGTLWAVSSVAGLLCAVRKADGHLSGREAAIIVMIGAVMMIPEGRRLALFAFGSNNFTWLAPATIADLGRIAAIQWIPFGHRQMAIASVAAASLLAVAIWQGRKEARAFASDRNRKWVVPTLLVGQAPLVWLVGWMVSPILMYRTILQTVPGVAVMLALIAFWLPGRWRYWLGSALAVAFLLSAFYQGFVQPKTPWGAAARRSASADVVLVCPAWQSPAFMAQSRSRAVLSWFDGQAHVIRWPTDIPGYGWEKAFYDRVRIKHGQVAASSVYRREQVRSVAVVMASCNEADQAAIAQWLKSIALRRANAVTIQPGADPKVELENGYPLIQVETWVAVAAT